jgi:hypothetical protein
MLDMAHEIELLECCASECSLIADLATDRRARFENEKLAVEYRQIAADLKAYGRDLTTEDTVYP